MTSTNAKSEQWADGPFRLQPYPVSDTSNGKKPSEPLQVAAQMARVHNMITRILNAIYLQAPHIKRKDVPTFIRYCKMWSELLHGHHKIEETRAFPEIEKQAGVPGLMSGNIDQHKLFEDGAKKFDEYLDDPETLKKFDGNRVRELIDGFGEVLTQHLLDEIQTLLDLKHYPQIKLMDIFVAVERDALKEAKFQHIAFAFTGHDVTFDDRRPLVEEMSWAMRWILGFFANLQGYTKFAPCNGWGKPKRPLYALKGTE